MIRRLLVSGIAVVASLAAGIAIGGGPLSDVGGTPSQAAPPVAHSETDPLAEARAAFGDSFAGAVAADLYAGRLHKHPVAVLTLPGADLDVVEALGAEVQAAGAQVLATYRLEGGLVEPGEKTMVDTLGVQLVAQLGDGVVTPDATTYDRMGQLIGRAVATQKISEGLRAAQVSSLRASLRGAGLVKVPDGDAGLAPLVLVVTGDEVEQPVLSGLVAGLAAVARGVVVAGPTADAAIADLREEPPLRPVATVDGTELPAGRVATILALVHAVSSPGGAYGASGSDGAIPLG